MGIGGSDAPGKKSGKTAGEGGGDSDYEDDDWGFEDEKE